MKPVLMVEGVACKLLELDFDENGVPYRAKARVEGKIKNFARTDDECNPSRYDIAGNLVYQNRYDDLFSSIEDLRKKVSDEMKLLALEYIREDVPPIQGLTKQKFHDLEQRAIALEDALEVIAEHMYKDVLK